MANLTLSDALALAAEHVDGGNLPAAQEICEQILAVDPGNADALHIAAHAYYRQGRLDMACDAVVRAQQLRPDDASIVESANAIASPAVLNNAGVSLTDAGRLSEAAAMFQRALLIDPSFKSALENLAVVYRLAGQHAAAFELLQKCLEMGSDTPLVHRNLGATLATAGRYEQAVVHLEKAVELDRSDFEASLDLGVCYLSMGESEKTKASFIRSSKLKPSAHAAVGECLSPLSSYYENVDEIVSARAQFQSNLTNLEDWLLSGAFGNYDDAWDAFSLQPFFLTYQGECDKTLLKRWGALLEHIAAVQFPQYTAPRTLAHCKRPDGKISVAFFSHSFSNHADWKMITNGWVDQLPRDKFHLTGYSSSMNSDWITGVAKTKFDSFVQEANMVSLAERIASDKPHVLIYLETGISPVSMRLASLRLAPVQCATWGKAGTSGLSTIDYFLSSHLMEPDDADSHYSERLVRLANLSSYYQPQVVEARGQRDGSVTRYLCVQSLFKFLPHHDELLCRIAANVKNAEFVFTSRPEGLADKVRARLSRAFTAHGLDSQRHLKFVPSLSELEYAELCSTSAAFLDTMIYSGCTTTIEALQQNLPVVTLPGTLMRARHSAAMLGVLDLPELIARNTDEYVEKATWLGLDRAWHADMSRVIASRKERLFRDKKPVEELTDFLLTVTS